jgi:CspA family cold shock protein
MQGNVKWFSPERHYGFITGEDKKDYFFHSSEVQGDNGKIFEGDEVEFIAEETKKGFSALKVVIKNS